MYVALFRSFSQIACRDDGRKYYKLKENLVRNTTCSEQMVYSAIETTCFGLYWPSSDFYNIQEESINAVKTVRGGC